MDMIGDPDMGDMSPGSGIPGYFYLQKVFWVAIGSAIAATTLMNVLSLILARQRSRSTSAKPRSFFWTLNATILAAGREITNATFPALQFKDVRIRSPPVGKTILVTSYMLVVLVLCFYGYNVVDQESWEHIAYRCGCIAETQLPLIFLLAGKKNIIGFFTGVSYEKLNYLHRWTARTLWLTVTFHMAFFFRSWARYDYVMIQLTTDNMTQTGFAGWCILTFIFITTFAPMRKWNYELFVITHIVTFAGLIGAIMIHVDDGIVYVWIPIGFYLLDRLLRTAKILYLNLNLSPKNFGFAHHATLTALPGNATRITIDKPRGSWAPGQHMFLSCHSVVPLQSHPFTISSLPSDDKIEFLVRPRNGGTKRFSDYASRYQQLPSNQDKRASCKIVAIEGPYGRLRALEQFDSVVFFAGGAGSTFTVPLMRDLVRRWQISSGSSDRRVVTRRIRFVWAVKSRQQLAWFEGQLKQANLDAVKCRSADSSLAVELDISIYVTCDEKLEQASNPSPVFCPPTLAGAAEEVDSDQEFSGVLGEKREDVVEVSSVKSSESSAGGCCRPNGSCCCKTTVEDEDEGDGDAPVCECAKYVPTPTDTAPEKSLPAKSEPADTAPLRILSGRPSPKSIIRKVLEEAEGESAVVVCGPQGQQDDVRRCVVSLSDERAVHKGTGAQGVYLHVEGFCY